MEEDGEEPRVAGGGRHVPKRALRNKSVIVGFDENDRREFITGFHKRKKQRRKIAKQQQEKKEREKRIEERKKRRLAIKLALGETSELPDEGLEGNLGGDVIEQSGDGYPDHVSTVKDTITYEGGDTTTIVNTSELHPEESDDVEIPHQKNFPSIQSKTMVCIPVKKQKSFKRIKKGNKGKKGKKLKKHISKRFGKRGKHKQ